MIRDPDKLYPGQPGFLDDPGILSFHTMPMIDSSHPALYGCFITLNGFAIGRTQEGTQLECAINGFNAIQRLAARGGY